MDRRCPCICVDFDSVSTFGLLEFGTVPTVWVFVLFCLFLFLVWFCCFFVFVVVVVVVVVKSRNKKTTPSTQNKVKKN